MGSVKEAAMEEQRPLMNKKAKSKQGQGYGSTPTTGQEVEVEVMEDSQEVEVDSQWQRVGKVLQEGALEISFALFLMLLGTFLQSLNVIYGKEGLPYKLAAYLGQQLFNSTKDNFAP